MLHHAVMSAEAVTNPLHTPERLKKIIRSRRKKICFVFVFWQEAGNTGLIAVLCHLVQLPNLRTKKNKKKNFDWLP